MSAIKVFATCPDSRATSADAYADCVVEVARWSEAAGCEGILVYADNGTVDAWLVAALILSATDRICPLVAVQPAYMHPYTAAKMVASFGYLNERKLYLNIVAGGFRKDLLALGDETPHDERYDRVVEYGRLINALSRDEAVSVNGRYYNVRNLRMTPPVPQELAPRLMVSGSSPAGLEAARKLDAIAVKYPQRPHEEADVARAGVECGMRVGIVTREDGEEAWRVALERFPTDRQGQIAHRYAMQVSDSEWHRRLSELAELAATEDNPYWLVPFENYKTFCPYLVGSHKRVAAELARYMRLGFDSFILDVPGSEEELHHISIAFERAQSAVTS